jgi:hypothetical protein
MKKHAGALRVHTLKGASPLTRAQTGLASWYKVGSQFACVLCHSV